MHKLVGVLDKYGGDFQLLLFPILKGRPCPSARLVYIHVSVICYATISYVAEKCVIIGYT